MTLHRHRCLSWLILVEVVLKAATVFTNAQNGFGVYGFQSASVKRIGQHNTYGTEMKNNDSSFLELFLTSNKGDCGTCVSLLGIGGSCSPTDPLKFLDLFMDAESSCRAVCSATINALKPMCCPTIQAGLESHCATFFGSAGCSSFLEETAVTSENTNVQFEEIRFAAIEGGSATNQSPPPSSCMSSCGCTSDGNCSGSNFNSLTCCNIGSYISNACLECVACANNPTSCGTFSEINPTESPTQAPTTQKPTQAPTTQKPTQAPTTQKPTQAPTTQTPTQTPTTKEVTGSTTTPAPPSGPRLMSDFLTVDDLCDYAGVDRWWYPTGGKAYDLSSCNQKNLTDCKPPNSLWGSYGPEGRYLDFWNKATGQTSWDRTHDRAECQKAAKLMIEDMDKAINLVRSKDSKFLGLFNNANNGIDKLEVAAFLAHVSAGTGGFAHFQETAPDRQKYGDYFGRGPLQLTSEANYQAFSDFMGDPSIKSTPDKLVDDPLTMWASGFWFWMHEATFDVWSNSGAIGICPKAHKGSMHWAVTQGPGFGLSIAILNGDVECNPKNSQEGATRREKASSRIKYLLWAMHILKIAPPNIPGLIIAKKNEQNFWNTQFTELPNYFTEGCPPIHEQNDKLACRGQLQKLGYDSSRYKNEDMATGPFYAGWDGVADHFDQSMGYTTRFDAPFPSVSSYSAVGYVKKEVECKGKKTQNYVGGQFSCSSKNKVCTVEPKTVLWIIKSIMRYQCDNKPTGKSMPSSCPTGNSENWPEGKWRTERLEWPNKYLQGSYEAPDENYDEDQDLPGCCSKGTNGNKKPETGSAKNQRDISDFDKLPKIKDCLTMDNLCDMMGATRWYYPNGGVNSQVCETCGPKDLFPEMDPPLRVEDIYRARTTCTQPAIPDTGNFTSGIDLWHICRQSSDNSQRPTGNVEAEWGSYSAEGQYVYQYGRLQQNKDPYKNLPEGITMPIFTFIEKYWNRTTDRAICHKAATYALEDMEAALVEVRKRSSRFDELFNNGKRVMDRIEMAAFLAHVNKETGSMSEWIESVDSTQTAVYGNGNIMCQQHPKYKCIKDVWYNGRGPIQLSWNYNYGKFSEFYFGNATVLLADPETIVRNPVIGWASAFWFWMEKVEFDVWSNALEVCPSFHEGSMHDAITRGAGFGLSTAIVNGAVECDPYRGDHQRKSMPLARLRYFIFNLWVLGVPVPEKIMRDKSKFWDEDFVEMPKYFYEGCPLISLDAQSGGNRSCPPKCKAMLARLGYYEDEPTCTAEYKPGMEVKGCPACTDGVRENQLLGAVHCGYNLNDPNSFQFELPWPAVGSLESLSFDPMGNAYCQIMKGTYKGKEYIYPRATYTDCMIQGGMCIYATDGTTQLGLFNGVEEVDGVITGVKIAECDPDAYYCCHSNSHKHLTKYAAHGYSKYVLWIADPLLRFQCDHCEPANGLKSPKDFECPTGECENFKREWPDGSWNNDPNEWPSAILES